MALYNFDSSQQFSNLAQAQPDFRPEASQFNPQQSVYNHNNPDLAAAEKLAIENLRISGAWVTVIPRSNDNKFNKTWNEDPDPTYYTGYDFKAFFVPPAPEVTLTKFGIDAPTKFEITFSRAEVLSIMGERLFRSGDVMVIPHNSLIINATRFNVLHVNDSGNYKYRWLYLTCLVESMNRDESLVPKNI